METDKLPVITLEEAHLKYPDQWLAVKVVERDERSGQPLKVRVIAKNIDIYSVRKQAGVDDICTFYTGPIPQTSTVLML